MVGDFDGLFEARNPRAARAVERLATHRDGVYFDVAGFEAGQIPRHLFEFSGVPVAELVPVEDLPDIFALAGCLEDSQNFEAISRYSRGITYELWCSPDNDPSTIAWWILSLLRIKTASQIVIPMQATHSWSAMSAAAPKSVRVGLIEDAPRAIRERNPQAVEEGDLDWVAEHLLTFGEMLEHMPFRTAVEAMTEYHLQPNRRLQVAAVWAGIEALFPDVRSELRFRLGVLAAAILEPRGETRIALYRAVLKLYDGRSEVVHGGRMDERKLNAHIVEATTLLRRLLMHYVEEGALPTAESQTAALLG